MHWVIGDIHGMRTALRSLVAAIRLADDASQFLFSGDYVNRGPDAKGVIDLLLSLEGARFARGNHDDIFDLVINGQSYDASDAGTDRLVAYRWFMNHGLDRTLLSYGADEAELEFLVRRPTLRGLDALVALVPDSHRRFIRNLEPLIEEKEFFVAHAKWNPDDRDEGMLDLLDRQPALRRTLIWGRFTEEQLGRRKIWRRVGYFGHTPVIYYEAARPTHGEPRPVPVAGPSAVLIDTGAAVSVHGRLTGYCVESHSFLQVDRDGALVNSDGTSAEIE